METIDAILTRRSIRSFKCDAIAKEDLLLLVKAAMQAPSANNYQPWHFVITTDKTILKEISRCHPYADMLVEAAAAITVCGDLKLEKMKGYNAINGAAATQNILLAAHDKGIGAVWLGVYPREERIEDLKEILKMPEHIFPISIIALGWPLKTKPPVDRYKAERVQFDTF